MCNAVTSEQYIIHTNTGCPLHAGTQEAHMRHKFDEGGLTTLGMGKYNPPVDQVNRMVVIALEKSKTI